jgi:hypothetical protein
MAWSVLDLLSPSLSTGEPDTGFTQAVRLGNRLAVRGDAPLPVPSIVILGLGDTELSARLLILLGVALAGDDDEGSA